MADQARHNRAGEVADWNLAHVARTEQLTAAPQKRQELVVVEAPHAARTGWLEHKVGLQAPHQRQVSIKNKNDDIACVTPAQQSKLAEAAQKCNKIQLVPGSIVDARLVAKRFVHVALQLGGVRRRQIERAAHQERARNGLGTRQPRSKRHVAKSAWLRLFERHVGHGRRQLIEPRDERANMRARVGVDVSIAINGNFTVAHRLVERQNEADEVAVRDRTLERLDVRRQRNQAARRVLCTFNRHLILSCGCHGLRLHLQLGDGVCKSHRLHCQV